MKTLLECQGEVAKKYGYDDFNNALRKFDQSKLTYLEIKYVIGEAAELYAEQYARQKCEEQKCLCLVSFSDAYIHLVRKVMQS